MTATRRVTATRDLVRTGALAGVLAAGGTTLVAVAASGADVPLEVDGQAIPASAFAWWTVIGAALGVLLARVLGDRRRFVVVASVLTALSLVPAVAGPDDTASRVVLVAAHLLAAAVVVPALARRLSPR
jgi:hypothetical protein